MTDLDPSAPESPSRADVDPLEAVRDRVLRRLLQVFGGSVAIAAVVFTPVLVRSGRFWDLACSVATPMLFAGFYFLKAPYRTRAWLYVSALSALSTVMIFADGLATGPTLVGFSVPFITVLFLGVRASFGSFAWWVASVASLGILDQLGIYRVPANPTLQRMDPAHWPFLALSQVFVGGPIVYLAHSLVSHLDASLRQKQQALEALGRAQEGLAATERHKTLGLLAGSIAHDLNNTLTVIACQVELARELSEDTRESILHATDAAGQLARQILVSAGRQVSQSSPIDVRRSLNPAFKALESILPGNVVLSRRFPERPLVVVADPVLLQQALLNLAVNARDAMPAGGELTVELTEVERDGRPWARIAVRDTGHGMEPEILARATEPFFTTKANGRGTGLGLANVRSTIEALAGKVLIESAPGMGTVVSLELPMTDASAIPEISPSAPGHAEGRTVLLVDDNLRVRAIAYETLLRAGYRVLEAGDLGRALELAARCEALDAAVCDLVLPDGSGLEVARRARQRFVHAGILVTSGYAPSRDDREALRQHEFPFLPKPFRPHQLLEALDAACRMREDAGAGTTTGRVVPPSERQAG